MKFSISREQLLRPLQLLTGVVERRQTMPVLGNILCIAGRGTLELVASDLEVEMDVRLSGVDVTREGETTIPARKLGDIVRSFGEGVSISIEVDADRTTIRSGRSRFILSNLPASDFPRNPASVTDLSFSLERSTFKRLIDRVSFAMAQQDVRFFLNGMLLEVTAEHVRTVATDGHRLAMFTVPGVGSSTERKALIVPRKGVMEIARILDGDADFCDVTIGKSHLGVQVGDYSLTTKLVDGQYPDYEKVVPRGLTRNMVLDRSLFRQALSRVSILSNEKYRGVRLKVEEDLVTVEAQNPEREEAEESLAVEYSGTPVEIGFNVAYLQDVLSAIDDALVRVNFTDSNGSALLEGSTDSGGVYVVMPMRL